MAENKIPVLTEVYSPKKSAKVTKSVDVPLELAPDSLAILSAQIRPALEAEIKDAILGELRREINVLQGEAGLETQNLVDAAIAAQSSDVPEALAEKVVSQVKPRLETEITDFVLDELRAEVKSARGEVISDTQDFVDKAKADLKTEMPKMYQSSIDLAQVDLTEKVDASLASVSEATAQLETLQAQLIDQHQSELNEAFSTLHETVGEKIQNALQVELGKIQEKAIQDHQTQLNEALDGFLQIKGEDAEKTLMQKMHDHQEKIRINYQEQLTGQMTNALESIKQRVEESTEEQIGIMHSQVGTIQQETFAKLREDFSVEKDVIFSEAVTEINTTLAEKMNVKSQEISDQFLMNVNGSLPDVQQILQENIQLILNNTIPDLEGRLRDELTEEIKQLLLKVKFVLPE